MTTKQVGVLELASKYRYGLTSRGAPLFLFKPYDQGQPDYIVGSTERDTSRNQIALVETPPGTKEKGRGTLLRLFGPVGDPHAEQAALLEYYCPNKHGKALMLDEDDDGDDENRQPLDFASSWITFHIDPPGCRDIDDAIAYHHDSRTWAITIADVAAAVPLDSPTDKIAAAIGSTFYTLEGQALRPMLPPAISEGSASLLPGQRRRGVTLFLHADGRESWGLTWITIDHSFTYDSFIGSAVAFDLQISKEPHAWIEELMIRYNRAAATLLKKAGVGLLRVQPPADAEKIKAWADIDPLLANEAAVYEPVSTNKEQTHASLGLYCHASSPLRRYADLTNQRILKTILKGQQPLTASAIAEQLNDRAKANKRWSRDLTFLTYVTPGRVHEIDVVWASHPQDGETQHVWAPLWKRLIRLRHEEPRPVGTKGRIQIFCDPTKRNWKQRILTASILG
jgi:exoribonuclease R